MASFFPECFLSPIVFNKLAASMIFSTIGHKVARHGMGIGVESARA
jgi:hypothetical protein